MRDRRFQHPWTERPSPSPGARERAQQLAEEIAGGPADLARLNAARETVHGLAGGLWEAFHDSFVAEVSGTLAKARAWVSALANAALSATADPGTLALLDREADMVRAFAAMRRDMQDPSEVWRNRWLRNGVTLWDHEVVEDLFLALRLCPSEALPVIEKLPTVDLAVRCFWGARVDRELVVAMVETAPRVFTEDGAWLPNRPITALLAIEQIVEHAAALDEALWQGISQIRSFTTPSTRDAARAAAEADRRGVQSNEIPQWLTEAFRVVLSRPDGRALALRYLAHLSREVLLGRRDPHEGEWSVRLCAVHALSRELRSERTSVAAIRATWDADRAGAGRGTTQGTQELVVQQRSGRADTGRGEGARRLHGEGLPWLLSAAHVLGNDPHDQVELSAFWSWMADLLEWRDDGLSLLFHKDKSLGDVTQRLGFLLSRMLDFCGWIRRQYARLEPQRRRAQYAFRYDEIDHDLPSVILVRVALYAVGNWADDVGKAQGQSLEGGNVAIGPMEGTFFWLFDMARRLWLTAALDTRDSKPILVPLFFAFAPLVFQGRIAAALTRMIPPIANDPEQLARAAWFFWRNDGEEKDAARTSRLFREAGADLEAALRDAHQWSVLTGRKESFPEELRALSEALGLALDAPPPTIENTAVTKRKRQDFLRAIPWGAALLHRIDEAGCTLRRLWRLGSQVDAWGLQVELPPALQEDIGLAAQLRILVVRGAVSGAELRRVINDPVEREHVDADGVVVAGDHPRLAQRVPLLGGPWGQRVIWSFGAEGAPPFIDALHDGLRAVDVFDRRDPVPPHALVGRAAQVQEIASLLAQGRAVGVFGLRKVGKTSLLRAVADALDPLGAAPGRENDEQDSRQSSTDTLVVLLDVQSLTKRTLDAVAGQLARRLSRRLESLPGHSHRDKHPPQPDAGAPFPIVEAPARGEPSVVYKENSDSFSLDGDAPAPDGVPELLSETPSLPPLAELDSLITRVLETTSLQLCFLIDEYDLLFEGYGGEPGVPGIERLFALLRGRAQLTGRIGVALVGRDPVFIERPLLFGFTNPLLGWTVTRWLGPLEREHAATLLRSLGRRVGLDVGPATIEAAFRWTGGHPLLLRQFGAAARECAIVHSPRGWHVVTDAFLEQTERKYRARPMVETACGEIRALLSARFPEAYRLLADVASAPPGELEAFLASHGGEEAPAAALLVHFGLLLPGAPAWIPATFRRAFGEAAGAARAGASG